MGLLSGNFNFVESNTELSSRPDTVRHVVASENCILAQKYCLADCSNDLLDFAP